jgi:hypothetical protein
MRRAQGLAAFCFQGQNHRMPSASPLRRPLSRDLAAFAALFGLGLLGIAALIPGLDEALAAARDRLPAEAAAIPWPLLLVQPALLLALGTLAGLATAHRVGLGSVLVGRIRGGAARLAPTGLAWAAGAGVAAGLAVVLGDAAFAALAPREMAVLHLPPERHLQALTLGLLYGGITEEIIMRWGLMSLLAWALLRLGLPRGAALAAALAASSVLFAAAHLPALFPLDPAGVVLLRTLVLNLLGGLVFGLVFLRHGLEAAMLAHAAAHLVIFAARGAGLA